MVKKHELLIDAQNNHASLIERIEDADAVVEQLSQELTYAEKHLSEATTAVAGLPPPNCQKLWVATRQNRRAQTTKCTVDPRMEAMKTNLQQATATRDAVKGRLASARDERAALKRDEVDRKLSEAQVAHKDAVLHSQLHSFTAMAFAKDPTQVTDGEIAWFLRIFVFAPAVFVSLASIHRDYCCREEKAQGTRAFPHGNRRGRMDAIRAADHSRSHASCRTGRCRCYRKGYTAGVSS